MTPETAQAVMGISKDDKFLSLLDHFKAISAELQEQINSPLTGKDERELLVHINDKLKREVIEVVKVAENILRKKEQLIGQA